MWESQATLRGQHASPHVPPNVATTQPAMFTDPFPQQGFVATQPPDRRISTPPSISGSSDNQILMMTSDPSPTVDLHLQTRSRQYPKPPAHSAPESSSSGSTEPLSTSNGPLHIPQPKVEVHPKIPKGPLHRNAASGRAAHSYIIVDDLAQSPAAISTLELLQSCPSQKKALLFDVGIVDPADDQMIVFDATQSDHPPLPPSIAFQIPVKI